MARAPASRYPSRVTSSVGDNETERKAHLSSLHRIAQSLATRQHPLEESEYAHEVDKFLENVDDDIDIDVADFSFDVVYSLLQKYASEDIAKNALAQYSVQSRAALLNNITKTIHTHTEELKVARKRCDALKVVQGQRSKKEALIEQESARKFVESGARRLAQLRIRQKSFVDAVAYAEEYGVYATKPDTTAVFGDLVTLEEHPSDSEGQVHWALVSDASRISTPHPFTQSDAGNISEDLELPQYAVLDADDVNEAEVDGEDTRDEEDELVSEENDEDDKDNADDNGQAGDNNNNHSGDDSDSNNDNEHARIGDPRDRQRQSQYPRIPARVRGNSKNDNNVCVQWKGPCDPCKRVGKTCTLQNPPRLRCVGCETASRPQKCTYNDVNVYGEVKGDVFTQADSNTVIAQYNGIGFSFPVDLCPSKRLLAESTVNRIEKHLQEPVQTTRHLERKIKLYDPPQAAETEYRCLKFKRVSKRAASAKQKLGSPVLTLSRYKTSTAPSARDRTPVPPGSEENTVNARPRAHIQRATTLGHPNNHTISKTWQRRERVTTPVDNNVPTRSPSQKPNDTLADGSGVTWSRTQMHTADAVRAPPVKKRRVHDAHTDGAGAVTTGDLDGHPTQHARTVADLVFPDERGNGPSSTSALITRSSVIDLLLAEHRARYNQLLARRFIVDSEIRELQEREENLTHQPFGEYVSLTSGVVLQPVLDIAAFRVCE
ncbi:hypothetical protein ONZ51_g7562 [Trametes cubensis]|uniref:Uncharacterized protein n=1 Tax=Trametes cubensis TaxID=1111947 RepID=A0AAD7TS04_9APHY|nr:hypothetical protein ONZ51_g7562 [Trametes cubensis]